MSQNNPLTAILEKQPFVVLDGAMATELEARGCNLADSLWSAKVLVENPELIREVHLDYYRAGAQVAITASYQATIMVSNGEKEASADSVMGLLMLEAAQGQSIHVTCEGVDAEAVMAAVEQLVAARFDEME